MLMRYIGLNKLFLAMFVLLTTVSGFSQNCRTFAKSKCLPELVPYIHDGQYNVTTLSPGESAQMYMTFYSGQEYRVLACAEESLGDKVIMKIRDANRNVIFDNSENNYVNWWAFNVKSSQQLIIEVSIPKQSFDTGEKPMGCVTILVGFMNSEGVIEKY